MLILSRFVQTERYSKHSTSFWREAAMLADLNHPNVLRFYGVVTESATDSTVTGIMTEYIKGGSLAQFLRYVGFLVHKWLLLTAERLVAARLCSSGP